ncbi:hypothetical protein V8V91_02940 [Algoriphagus halophilus]|uniref:hypothetical protein n=1 Tax=Algoriphagus halophilus TaxID=226505 RepID=UPI00358E96E7
MASPYLGGYRAPKEVESNYSKYDTVVPPTMNWYIFTQYVLLLLLTGFFLFQVNDLDLVAKVGVSVLII